MLFGYVRSKANTADLPYQDGLDELNGVRSPWTTTSRCVALVGISKHSVMADVGSHVDDQGGGILVLPSYPYAPDAHVE